MEGNLHHNSEGPMHGKPFRLCGWELDVLASLYEYDPAFGDDPRGPEDWDPPQNQAQWEHLECVIGVPKGSAKTELLSAVGLEHMAGPTAPRGRPVIPVAATTEGQAKLILNSAQDMVEGTRLETLFKPSEKRLVYTPTRARMYLMTAGIGSNDGIKPSLALGDELHEWDSHWLEAARRWHVTVCGGVEKRRGRAIGISTAGWNLESLLGGLYEYGCKVASGELIDPRFFFYWREASEHWDLEDPDQLLAAIREASPVADIFWPASDQALLYQRLRDQGKAHEFLRYRLNRWVSSIETWVPLPAWDERAEPRDPPSAGAEIVIGFDGSYSGDSTAIVGVDLTSPLPWLWVIGTWEKPDPAPDGWRVPTAEVAAALRTACRQWEVRAIAADLNHWRTTLEQLADDGLPIVEFDQGPHRMVPACHRFFEHVTQDRIRHSGDPRLRRHLANCRAKHTEGGVRVAKEHPNSKRYIDLAAAAIMGHDEACGPEDEPTESFVAWA
jgi:phage terminase large subunit-like protein